MNRSHSNPPEGPILMSESFRLHYHVENMCDGSVAVRFHQTEAEAEKADADQIEGWSEPGNGSLALKVDQGKLYYRAYAGGKWTEVQPHDRP